MKTTEKILAQQRAVLVRIAQQNRLIREPTAEMEALKEKKRFWAGLFKRKEVSQ